MATKKAKIVATAPTNKGLHNEVELLKHELGTLKELLYSTEFDYATGFKRYHILPHISYKALTDKSKLKILGESFSKPRIYVLPLINCFAKIIVQTNHFGFWHIHENGIKTVQIDENGNFNIDLTIFDEYAEGFKIIAVDIKTGRTSNELVF